MNELMKQPFFEVLRPLPLSRDLFFMRQLGSNFQLNQIN